MSKKIRIGLVSRTLTLRDEVPTYQKAPYVPRDIVTILGELGALPIVFPDVEGASGKDYVDLADALWRRTDVESGRCGLQDGPL